MNARLRDIAFNDTGFVELFFDDRRIMFDREDGGRTLWVIVSRPPHPRDGSGFCDDALTVADVIARGTAP